MMASAEEDFLKSCLVPSFFESDSETEEAFGLLPDRQRPSTQKQQKLAAPSHLQAHSGKPLRKITSCETFSKATSLRKQNSLPKSEPSIKEEASELSSPSSRGTSSTLTPFRSGALESVDSLDNSSAFCSVLSFESTDSVFDFDSSSSLLQELSPSKRQKVDSSVMLGQSRGMPPLAPTSFTTQAVFTTRKPELPASNSFVGSTVRQTYNAAPRAFTSGDVTTGIPVDSCHADMSKMWPTTQVMIPITTQQLRVSGNNIFERVSAALAEINQAPTAKLPLGLCLDKTSVVKELNKIGMTFKD